MAGNRAKRKPTAGTEMAFDGDRENLRERTEGLRLDFIRAEIDLAFTFCETAAFTNDPEKRQRNIAEAEEGYSTCKRFLGDGRMDGSMRHSLEERMSGLERRLRELRRE